MSDDFSVSDVLRIIAFFVGLLLLISGFADFAAIGGSDVVAALSTGPIALIKVIVGVILMILAINPDAIAVIIGWMVRTPQ